MTVDPAIQQQLLNKFERASGHCSCKICEKCREVAKHRGNSGWQFISHMIGCSCDRCHIRATIFGLA